MTEINKKLLSLIADEKTINQISKILNLSHKQIYSHLRTLKLHGFEFQREYHYDGNIKYFPQNQEIEINQNGIDLITKNTDQQITIMLISDVHLGSEYDRIDLLNKIYEYCTKNNIHIIINAGDIVDGITTGLGKKHKTFDEQLEYALKNYPFDKNIINFICLGNHDIEFLQANNQDLTTVLYNYRHDLVSLGYGLGSINVKNEKIFVKHHISGYKTDKIPNESLILLGHSHKASITYNGSLSIHIPALCDLRTNDNFGSPGATLMKITFEKGYYKTGYFEQFIINQGFHTINEFRCDILPNRTIKKNNQVILEENGYGQYSTNPNGIQKKKSRH